MCKPESLKIKRFFILENKLIKPLKHEKYSYILQSFKHESWIN